MLDSEIRGFLLHNFFSDFFSISSSAYDIIPNQSHNHGSELTELGSMEVVGRLVGRCGGAAGNGQALIGIP